MTKWLTLSEYAKMDARYSNVPCDQRGCKRYSVWVLVDATTRKALFSVCERHHALEVSAETLSNLQRGDRS